MNLNLAHINTHTARISVVIGLCLVPISAQAQNPWGTPSTQPYAAPVQPAPPAPKPKYYQEPVVAAPSDQASPATPDKFAPADLDRQLSAPHYPAYQNTAPYGYQGAPQTPYAGPPTYNGPPPAGYLQGYPMGGSGGYRAPFGNNSWGGMPSNNYSPFGMR